MIRLVYADGSASIDGIRSYAERCCDALRRHEMLDAELEFWRADHEPTAISDGDIIVVQYNPFSYGRRGVAPWLVRRLRRIRQSSPRARIVLVVHEAYVPARSLRWTAMGAWQRGQLALLGRAAHGVVVSTESWRRGVTRLVGAPPLAAIPVGSNLPDLTAERSETRLANGWTEETLVVAALGADRAARLADPVVAAITRIADVDPRMAFANLGTAPIDVPHDAINVRQYSPGRLSDDQLARELSAADLFLAPYEDGVSMRRTTLAAALQHSLAVVGTDGRNTETELRETHALRLAPVTDSGAFADIALALAQNAGQRDELRSQARAFFDRHLSWPVIAAKYRAVLEAVVGGPID